MLLPPQSCSYVSSLLNVWAYNCHYFSKRPHFWHIPMLLSLYACVGSGSGISEDSCDYKSDNNDVTIKQNPCVTKPRSSALPPRLPRAQKLSSPSVSATNARTTFFHDKNATQHLHQNCLCTLTSSYRHLANSYTLLPNDSTTYTILNVKNLSVYNTV